MLAPETLKNKVVMITGAGTGIGRGFALRAAALGARVALAGRRGSLLEVVAAEIRAAGGEALVCAMDIRNSNEVQAQVDRVVKSFGRIDVMINNAAGNFVSRAEDISPNGWNTVINTVLNGTAY